MDPSDAGVKSIGKKWMGFGTVLTRIMQDPNQKVQNLNKHGQNEMGFPPQAC